jgi:hypothetical protein
MRTVKEQLKYLFSPVKTISAYPKKKKPKIYKVRPVKK